MDAALGMSKRLEIVAHGNETGSIPHNATDVVAKVYHCIWISSHLTLDQPDHLPCLVPGCQHGLAGVRNREGRPEMLAKQLVPVLAQKVELAARDPVQQVFDLLGVAKVEGLQDIHLLDGFDIGDDEDLPTEGFVEADQSIIWKGLDDGYDVLPGVIWEQHFPVSVEPSSPLCLEYFSTLATRRGVGRWRNGVK